MLLLKDFQRDILKHKHTSKSQKTLNICRKIYVILRKEDTS